MGFETLVEAGYQPEIAYFECLHELKRIVDLMYERGLAGMRYPISDTAEYGDLTRGPKVIDDHVRQNMEQALKYVQQGAFASETTAEEANGRPNFKRMREEAADTSWNRSVPSSLDDAVDRRERSRGGGRSAGASSTELMHRQILRLHPPPDPSPDPGFERVREQFEIPKQVPAEAQAAAEQAAKRAVAAAGRADLRALEFFTVDPEEAATSTRRCSSTPRPGLSGAVCDRRRGRVCRARRSGRA